VSYSKSSPSLARGQSGQRWTPLSRGSRQADEQIAARRGYRQGGAVHDDGPNPDRPKKGLHPADQTKIWAQPGEYVIRKDAVDHYGPDIMEAINSGAIDPNVLRQALGGGQGMYQGGMVQQNPGIQRMGNQVSQAYTKTPPESQPQTTQKKEKKSPLGMMTGGQVPGQQQSGAAGARSLYGQGRGPGAGGAYKGQLAIDAQNVGGPAGLIGMAGLHGDKNYTNYLEQIAPHVAMSLAGTQEYANAQNFNQFINPMQQYGVGAGQIAQGAQQGLTQAQNALSSQGLGRSAAMSSLANQASLNAASGQADLFSGLYQQGQTDRYNATQNNYSMLQDVVNMALGNNPLSERMLRYSTYGRPKNDGRPTENDLVKESLAGWL
jgi:hypothetical protein